MRPTQLNTEVAPARRKCVPQPHKRLHELSLTVSCLWVRDVQGGGRTVEAVLFTFVLQAGWRRAILEVHSLVFLDWRTHGLACCSRMSSQMSLSALSVTRSVQGAPPQVKQEYSRSEWVSDQLVPLLSKRQESNRGSPAFLPQICWSAAQRVACDSQDRYLLVGCQWCSVEYGASVRTNP